MGDSRPVVDLGPAPDPRPDVATALVAGFGAGAGEDVFGALNDLVLVVAPDRRVVYANAICEHVLGRPPRHLVGLRLADLVHPDDLERGLRAEERIGTPAAAPAVAGRFRLRHVDGSWLPVALNAGRLGPPGARHTLVTGRIDHDLALQERIMALLSEGAPVDRVIEVVPSFGTWRFPRLPFAVGFDGPHLPRQVVGGPLASDLLRALGRLAPWERDGLVPLQPIRGTAAELDAAGAALAAQAGCTDWVVLPVGLGDGVTGAIATGWTSGAGPAVTSVEAAVRTMGRSLGLVLQWHHQRVALEQAASCDPLTGVANRTRALAELEAALDRPGEGPVAVVVFDVDGLRAVNDAEGVAAGDAVLVELVRRIEAVRRPGDRVGRLGGDEVLVVCRGLAARGGAEALARDVCGPLSGLACGRAVTVSAGAVVADGAGRSSLDDLLARAGGALCVAKSAGGGRVVVTTSRGGLDRRELGEGSVSGPGRRRRGRP